MTLESLIEFERKIIEDIAKINLEAGNSKISNQGPLTFAKDGSQRYRDVFLYATGRYDLERRLMFNVSGGRKIYFIDKFIEPYLHLLIPYIKGANANKILFSFGSDDQFQRNTDTVILQDEYVYEKLKVRVLYLNSAVKKNLDTFSNIRILDSLANEKVNSSKISPGNIGLGIYFHKMILAKLSGNNMYDDIYKNYVEILEREIAKQKESFAKANAYLSVTKRLYDDLKNVHPLENPILI